MVYNIYIFGSKMYTDGEEGYINYGFYNAIKENKLNKFWQVYWFNDDNIQEFQDLLKIPDNTHHDMYIINTHKNNDIIPVNQSNFYVLIKFLDKKFLKMYKKLVIKEYNKVLHEWRINTYKEIGKLCYLRNFNMIMPWGSLLTPNQIKENLKSFIQLKDREDKYISVRKYNNMTQFNKSNVPITIKRIISIEDELDLVKKIKFSCCFSNNFNTIDYKVLTHISNGTLCITDCQLTHEFLDEKTCYISDTSNLKDTSETYFNNFEKYELYTMMEDIANNHTFLNRLQLILDYFNIKT
jgi:hypothetical protein